MRHIPNNFEHLTSLGWCALALLWAGLSVAIKIKIEITMTMRAYLAYVLWGVGLVEGLEPMTRGMARHARKSGSKTDPGGFDSLSLHLLLRRMAETKANKALEATAGAPCRTCSILTPTLTADSTSTPAPAVASV